MQRMTRGSDRRRVARRLGPDTLADLQGGVEAGHLLGAEGNSQFAHSNRKGRAKVLPAGLIP
jgi:hypothetical protein